MTYRRTDTTQTELIATLRCLGCSVVSLASLGKGCPDLAVAVCQRTYLVELKDGKKSWKLTDDQKTFIGNWQDDIPIMESVDDCIEFVQAVRDKKFDRWIRNKYLSLKEKFE